MILSLSNFLLESLDLQRSQIISRKHWNKVVNTSKVREGAFKYEDIFVECKWNKSSL